MGLGPAEIALHWLVAVSGCVAGRFAVLAVSSVAVGRQVVSRAALSARFRLALVEDVASFPAQLDGRGEVCKLPVWLVSSELNEKAMCPSLDSILVSQLHASDHLATEPQPGFDVIGPHILRIHDHGNGLRISF